MSILALALTLSADHASASDAEFLEGLRARRLFSLAEDHCRDELAVSGITARRRAELTIELLRTLSRHAAQRAPEDRAPLWQECVTLGERFTALDGANPRAPLVRLQLALVELERAELERQESEVRADPDAISRALDAIRRAVDPLEKLHADLLREIPERRRRPPDDPDALTADELFALQNHVEGRLAAALRVRAACYPPGSDDQLAALNGALEWGARPERQLPADAELVLEMRIEQAACQRMLGRYAAAEELLAPLRDHAVESVRRAARLETARLHLDRGAPQEALRALADTDLAADAETDFVRLEALTTLWKQAQSPEETEKWRASALELARRIGEVHGPYWRRRADRRLAREAAAGAVGGGLEILRRQADDLYLEGRLPAAITAYDEAAQKAAEAGDVAAQFELSYRAALVVARLPDRAVERARRLRDLAVAVPQEPRAAATHLQAVLAAAQRVAESGAAANSDPGAAADSLARYEQWLAEHLRLWPDSDTSHDARLWLAQLRRQQREWSAALELLTAIPAASPRHAEALLAAEACWLAQLDAARAEGQSIEAPLRIAIALFEGATLGDDGRPPATWTPVERTGALAAARLWLRYTPRGQVRAASFLEAALRGPPEPDPAWALEARTLLVVALAAQPTRQADAAATLRQLESASPAQLLTALEGLASSLESSPADARSGLATMLLDLAARLQRTQPPLGAPELLRVRKVEARALAAADRRDEAGGRFEQLIRESPRDAGLQREYAEFLATADDAESLQRAIDQWTRVGRGSRPRSDLWYESKYRLAELQLRLGKREEAAALLDYVEATAGLAGTAWQERYRALRAKCR